MTPMGFLLDPNITSADIYTTLSHLWIEHDQITVQWEETDLYILPKEVSTSYASIMRLVSTVTSLAKSELPGSPRTIGRSIVFTPTSTSASPAVLAVGSTSLTSSIVANEPTSEIMSS